MDKKMYLVFENGQVFQGAGFGADADVTGEAVFTTSVVGTTQALTDPGFHGKLLVSSFPFSGNYGVIPAEMESTGAHVKAHIVREWCRHPSNFRSEGEVDTFLREQGVSGLEGVDTRRIVKLLRDFGPMNARLTPDKDGALRSLDAIRAHKTTGAVASVGRRDTLVEGEGERTVVMLDLGATNSFRREFTSRGMRLISVPHTTSAAEIVGMNPDGVVISNGPGAPAENHEIQREIAALYQCGLPLLAVGLGHLRLALALGGKVTRMKCGRHGANQPVRDENDERIYIAGQAHTYEVDKTTLPVGARTRYSGVNGGGCEGIDYDSLHAISTQFIPGVAGGVADTAFIYDRFIKRMGGVKRAAQ